MTSPAARLHDAIAALAPIESVSIGRKDDRSTWEISFAPEASAAQRQAALAALQAFDADAPEPAPFDG
jgi:hypothetical protein